MPVPARFSDSRREMTCCAAPRSVPGADSECSLNRSRTPYRSSPAIFWRSSYPRRCVHDLIRPSWTRLIGWSSGIESPTDRTKRFNGVGARRDGKRPPRIPCQRAWRHSASSSMDPNGELERLARFPSITPSALYFPHASFIRNAAPPSGPLSLPAARGRSRPAMRRLPELLRRQGMSAGR